MLKVKLVNKDIGVLALALAYVVWIGVFGVVSPTKLMQGKLFMGPLLLCSIFSMAVLMERWWTLTRYRSYTEEFGRRIGEVIESGEVDQALRICESSPAPAASILEVGLKRFKQLKGLGRPSEMIEEGVVRAMEDHSEHVVASLEEYLPILAIVASVAPLFGFAGTVTGMISSFGSLAEMGFKPEYVSVGIQEALVTTATGLVIAIPAALGYNYYTGRVQKFMRDIAESVQHLVDRVILGSEAQEKSA